MTAEDDLARLKSKADAAHQRYLQTRAEIDAKKALLAEAKADLAALGCASLAEADERISDLRARLDDQVGELARLLA